MASIPRVCLPSSALLNAQELETAVCCALQCDPSALQSINCSTQKSGSAADGFLSQCGSMTVTAVSRGRSHELHLFVKRADTHDVIGGLDSFEREGLFYTKVLPHLEKAWRSSQRQPDEVQRSQDSAAATAWTRWPDLGPAAYLATNNVVVMEDLTRLGYGATPDWLWSDLDYETVQQTLRALARIHAATLLAERCHGVNLEEIAPDLLVENFFTRRPGSVGRRLVDCGVDVLTDCLLPKLFHRLDAPQTEAELQRLRDAARDFAAEVDMEKLRAEDPTGVRVLSHGDTWPNNVLVKRDEQQGRTAHAVLVDFQMSRLGLPAWDVVMFLFVATRRAFREKHMDRLLDGYHHDLNRFALKGGLDISKVFGREVFLASVRRLTRPARMIRALYVPLLGGDEADMVSVHKDTDTRTALLLDSATRGAMVRRWCDADPRYSRLVQECVEELLQLPPTASSP